MNTSAASAWCGTGTGPELLDVSCAVSKSLTQWKSEVVEETPEELRTLAMLSLLTKKRNCSKHNRKLRRESTEYDEKQSDFKEGNGMESLPEETPVIL